VLNNLIGVPVTLSIAVFYLLSCVVLVKVLENLQVSKYLSFFMFILILYQPVLFPMRVIRDTIYHSLTLFVVAGAIYLVSNNRTRMTYAYAGLFGIMLGFFWVTREEGVWIMPGIGLLVVYALIRSVRENEIQHYSKVLFVYIFGAVSPVLAISVVNYHEYGVFETVDTKETAYVKALNKLYSVSIQHEIPYIPVPRSKRELIYQVSPTFKTLENYFEVAGKGWSQHGCGIYPHACNDYAGGWFTWAFRDAVASQGHYTSPDKANEFYNNIYTEIDTACKDGVIKCQSSLIPGLPRITSDNIKNIPARFLAGIKTTIYDADIAVTMGNSFPPKERLKEIREFIGGPKIIGIDNKSNVALSGWFYSTSDWIQLDCFFNDKSIVKDVERRASPDIASHFDDEAATYQRFSFNVSESDNCKIQLESQPDKFVYISMLEAVKGHNLGEGILYIDNIARDDFVDVNKSRSIFIKKKLFSIYEILSPYVLYAGIIFFILSLYRSILYRSCNNKLLIVAGVTWIFIMSRTMLLVLVDISLFPAINFLYFKPLYPLIYLAAFLSFASLISLKLASANTEAR